MQTQRIQESGQFVFPRRRLARFGKVGEANQSIVAKCIQGPVTKTPIRIAGKTPGPLGGTADRYAP
jgi:hypothetical protein